MIDLKKFALCLDIKEGDILLAGKYKNKRMEVEKIDTDELGQPTVNGQKLLAVRIEKELPKDKMSAQTQEEMKKESSMLDLQKIAEDGFQNELEKIAISEPYVAKKIVKGLIQREKIKNPFAQTASESILMAKISPSGTYSSKNYVSKRTDPKIGLQVIKDIKEKLKGMKK